MEPRLNFYRSNPDAMRAMIAPLERHKLTLMSFVLDPIVGPKIMGYLRALKRRVARS